MGATGKRGLLGSRRFFLGLFCGDDMKTQWFRLYGEVVDDEKLRLLAFEDRWHYIALLALKSTGLLDRECDSELLRRQVAVKMGLQLVELENVARRLKAVGLIGDDLQPSAWDRRQFQSDSSTLRSQKCRQMRRQRTEAAPQRSGNVAGNAVQRCSVVPATPPDTDTDTEEKKDNTNVLSKENPLGAVDFAEAEGARPIPSPEPAQQQLVNDRPLPTDDPPLPTPQAKPRKPTAPSPEEQRALLAEFDITGQLATDYLTLRYAKRVPITRTALDRLRLEAGKAGIPIEEAVTFMISQGWRGFSATWYWNANRSEADRGQRRLSLAEQAMQCEERIRARDEREGRVVETVRRGDGAAVDPNDLDFWLPLGETGWRAAAHA